MGTLALAQIVGLLGLRIRYWIIIIVVVLVVIGLVWWASNRKRT